MMQILRIVFFNLLLAGTFVCSADDPPVHEFPFQVVYAENVTRISSGEPVQQFEFIGRDEVLQLVSGYMILAHYSRKLYEFEGNELVDIYTIAEDMEKSYELTEDRYSLNKLFRIKEKNEFDEMRRYMPRAAVSDQYEQPITLIIPSIYNSYFFSPATELCLSWKVRAGENHDNVFRIEVVNMYDQIIYNEEVTGFNHLLDLDPFMGEEMILIKISSASLDYKTEMIPIRFQEHPDYKPNYCFPMSAVNALEMALFVEEYVIFGNEEYFYNLATQISDRQIFKDFYQNYLERK